MMRNFLKPSPARRLSAGAPSTLQIRYTQDVETTVVLDDQSSGDHSFVPRRKGEVVQGKVSESSDV